MTEQEVIQNILNNEDLSQSMFNVKEYPLPEPHKLNEKVKAFILGADPSNFSDGGKFTNRVSVVFDIGKDKRYFTGINNNLKEIGLSLDSVYVQNMVRNYMDKETNKNPKWTLFAEKWLPYIKQEFDTIDSLEKVPVFVTAEIILKFLLTDSSNIASPKNYYNGSAEIPIPPSENRLERNLIPLYRHHAYSLKKYVDYKERIIEIFNSL